MRRLLVGAVALIVTATCHAADLDDAISAIRAVGAQGTGNERAAASWKVVVAHGGGALPSLLAAFDGADATAANWLRTAIEAIAEREQGAGRILPSKELESFVLDKKRCSRGREMAFELLSQIDPSTRRRLLPSLIDDESGGLRREAISLAIEDLQKKATGSDKAQYNRQLEQILKSARDIDQVDKIAKELKTGGVDVDLVSHFGLITRWQIAGPYDNLGLRGFHAELPTKVEWKDHATGEARGIVELYGVFGRKPGLDPVTKKKEAIYALARTEVESASERAVEIRAGSQNAVRIWLNGHEVFSREEYHHGFSMDQHVVRATLKSGRNEILLKVCQDDEKMDFTFPWSFQLRICDSIGGAVPVKVLTAPNAVPVKPEPKKEPMK
jgi:hypothetical protein